MMILPFTKNTKFLPVTYAYRIYYKDRLNIWKCMLTLKTLFWLLLYRSVLLRVTRSITHENTTAEVQAACSEILLKPNK